MILCIAAAVLPKLKLTAARTGAFIGICLDLDAPFKSFPLLSPIFHWMQHDELIPNLLGNVKLEVAPDPWTSF